ncbi:Lrp/AsnC family transcriptional regulator [Chelativorans xinjiangense]|uniref:Lrp/AsnC family transcriptional regulator n=1 Tax=Chelativorans xinjiangense TaxID=2681485 RepID=UPI00135704B6|nr:Lrp/AsnC family transcriptional regulator [Chelativorans xinjiangense]
MDRLDVRILEALQHSGDLTHAELAEKVGSTQSTCLRRVQRLKDSGHLNKSVYLADPARLERGLRVFIVVTTKEHDRRKRMAFAAKLKGESAITLAYGVTGEVDALLMGNFASMAEYQETCDRLFDGDDNVVRYTTFFVAETYKETTAIPCDALLARLSDLI